MQTGNVKYVDLSHLIESGVPTYMGLPAPLVCDFLSREASRSHYDEGTEFHIAKIEMVANTGTYMDCPFHRFVGGKGFPELEIGLSADLPAVKVTSRAMAVDVDAFIGLELKGKAVLIETGWSKNWGTEKYFSGHPFVTAAAAELLVRSGAKLVGIDSHNIDDTRTRTRPVHSTLLANEILIVEHLTNLDALPIDGFIFTAVPPKFKGVGTFPVRAYARLS